MVLTQLRAEIGKLTLDATFSAREQINSVLLQDLDVATAPWGVKILRIEVRDIVPNRGIMKAMELHRRDAEAAEERTGAEEEEEESFLRESLRRSTAF